MRAFSWQHLINRNSARLAALRWTLRGIFARPFTSDAKAIIIGGSPRSGTTLLRVMLNAHKNLCAGPESFLFTATRVKVEDLAYRFEYTDTQVRALLSASGSHAQFIDAFLGGYCKRAGKRRWAEKTPKNVREYDRIFRMFPEGRFVHVIRDGRDTICSLRTHPKFHLIGGKLVPCKTSRPIEGCANMWVREVEYGLAHRGDSRYAELRYEELIDNPEKTLRGLFEFLGEEWDADVLKFHEKADASHDATRNTANPTVSRPISANAVGRWRTDLTPEEARVVQQIAGPLLLKLGYVKDAGWVKAVAPKGAAEPMLA